ncbi:hypothetical protein ACHAQJ_009354 [Trichoderma viride]
MHFSTPYVLGLLCQVLPAIGATHTSKFGTITQSQNGSVLDVVFYNNSTDVNLWDTRVQSDFFDLVTQLQKNEAGIKAVVFRSGNPDFFFGLLDFVDRPGEPAVTATAPQNTNNAFALFHNVTQLPMTTIAAVDGRAHGIGNEFLVSLDMRFATKNNSIFGQPEVTAGIIPSAGGAQNLAHLIGRGRTMEYVLSGKDISAEEAERIGWINKAFDTASEMNTYVDELAQRIGLFPLDGITAARTTINDAGLPTLQQLDDEFQRFAALVATNQTLQLLEKLVQLTKNESSVPFFLNFGTNALEIYGK